MLLAFMAVMVLWLLGAWVSDHFACFRDFDPTFLNEYRAYVSPMWLYLIIWSYILTVWQWKCQTIMVVFEGLVLYFDYGAMEMSYHYAGIW